jgi:hypothetical protein
MSTFGQMVERIRVDLDRGTDFDTRIKRAIVDAIVFYRSNRLGFNTKRARALITSGMETVSLPTDWIESDFMRLEDDGDRMPFIEVGFEEIEGYRESDDDRGMPQYYAIQHREMRLYPIPDQSYSLVFSFQYELKDISLSQSDNHTNAWLTEADQLIYYRAKGDLLINYIDGEEATRRGMMLHDKADGEILPKLEAQAAREQSAGRIRSFI